MLHGISGERECRLDGQGRSPDPRSGGKVCTRRIDHVEASGRTRRDSEGFGQSGGGEILGEVLGRGRSASRSRPPAYR